MPTSLVQGDSLSWTKYLAWEIEKSYLVSFQNNADR